MPAGSCCLEFFDFAGMSHELLPVETLANTHQRSCETYRGQEQFCSAVDISANSTSAETPDEMA